MGKASFAKRVGAVAATAAVSCALCVTMAGCATQNSGNVTSAQDENSGVEAATITTRTVTFPAAYFADQTEDEVRERLQNMGCTDIVVNESGSYTATMPLDKYNALVDSWHESTANPFNEMPNSEQWSTITAIDYDDQFSKVTLTTSSSQVGIYEAFAPLQVGLVACMYQQFAGQPVNCVVRIVDQSGAELSSSTYPDVLSQEQRDSIVAN